MSVKPSVKLGILAVVATTSIIIYITFSTTTNQGYYSLIVTESFNKTSTTANSVPDQKMVATTARNSKSCLVSTIEAPDMKKINTFADLNTALCENGKIVHGESVECPEKGIVTMIPGGRTGR